MRRTVGRYTLGFVLVALGAALALESYGAFPAFREGFLKWWPLAFVILGVEYIVLSRDPEVNVRISGGAVFLTVLVLASAWVYDVGSAWGGLIRIGGFGDFLAGSNTCTLEAPINEAFGTGVTGLSVRATGDVVVTGEGTGSVTGTATLKVRARTVEEAQRYADEMKLVPRYSGKTLYLEFTRPSSVPASISVLPSFVLNVPEDSDLEVRTVSGDIEVKGVRGRLDLDSVSGDVFVDENPLRVDVNMVSGDFEGVLGSDMDELFVKTVSGDIEIEVPEGMGGTVQARTVSGSISDSGEGLNITKSPGRRQASGSIGAGRTKIDVDTVSGDVSFK